MRRSSRWLLVAACGLAAVPGCGPSGPTLYPVRGTVTVSGRPAANAIVFLHRTGRTDMAEPVPFGRAGENGEFVVTTPPDGTGAMAGDYVLTVVWPDMTKPENGSGERPDALGGSYAKPQQSKLAAVVKPEPNVLPPFDLTPPAVLPRKAADPNDK